MLRSKTRRSSLFRGENRRAMQASNVTQHWADVWLPRLSHFAQFGLFLFTLGISYFTVLPLYQKAVLEESIAKKEIEYNELNKSLDVSYTRLRSYSMKQFYIEAMPVCSMLVFIGSKQATEEDKRKSRAEQLFELNVPECLTNLGEKVEALNELRPSDRKTFEAELNQIGRKIAAKRTELKAVYENAAQRVTDADFAALSKDLYTVQAQVFIERIRGGIPDPAARRKISESVAKEKIGSQYQDFIRDQLRSLNSIEWIKAP